jgi:hypothetical protein
MAVFGRRDVSLALVGTVVSLPFCTNSSEFPSTRVAVPFGAATFFARAQNGGEMFDRRSLDENGSNETAVAQSPRLP